MDNEISQEVSNLIIMKSGYSQAVSDFENIVDNIPMDETLRLILKDKMKRKQKAFILGDTEYEATIYKYYLKDINMGYVIFDDIYEIKGVLIDLNKTEITEIPEKEILTIRKEILPDQEIKATNKEYAKMTYENILKPFKK